MPLKMNHISVSFSGSTVLKDINLQIEDGTVHAILGANGSGKSTLIKVLSGIYHPDKADDSYIELNGIKKTDITDTQIAYDLGVRTVHQESPLINDFTVAECVSLFKGYPKRHHMIDWKSVKEYTEKLLTLYNINITPEMLVRNLSASQRNMLSIAIAIGEEEELVHTKLLILDEADASIPEAEAEFFLHRIREVAKRGIPIIMITHRIKSVMQYCDRITLLNDGTIVYDSLVKNSTEETIVSYMLKKGEEIKSGAANNKVHSLSDIWTLLKKNSSIKKGDKILEIQNVKAKDIKDLSFSLYAGEILGIVGAADNGISELPYLLGGNMQRTCGKYIIHNHELPRKLNPHILLKNGLAVLPSDRPKYGGIMECSLKENIFMPNEIQFWHRNKLKEQILNISQEVFDIQPSNSYNQLFETFSGGNQQKAIMAKWLSLRPSIFVLNDPTYGVDPGSRKHLFDLIKEAAYMNVGVIIFTTEPEQLVDLCTRVIFIKNGKVSGEIDKKDVKLLRETIARWSYL